MLRASQGCFSILWLEFQVVCASTSDKDVRSEIVGMGFVADVGLSGRLTSLYFFI